MEGSEAIKRSSSPAEPRWRFIERTVAALEHMLAPGAQVYHNQQVPEIISGIARQCDVVVRYGTPPRQTLAAIVEVQDRGSKIGLQDFEAWCAKRGKLGAQRLICVSCEGFTEDVEKTAMTMGDVVSLVTLCQAGQRPAFLSATGFAMHLRVLHYRDAKVVFNDRAPNASFLVEDKVFETPESNPKLSLHSLAESCMVQGFAKDVQRCEVNSDFHDLKYRVEFGAAGRPLSLTYEGQTYSVHEVYFSDRIEEIHQGLEPTPLAYEQKNVDGVLAWVLLSMGSYNGKEFYIQHSFRQLPNGKFQMGASSVSKIEGMHHIAGGTEVLVSVTVP